MKTNELRIGNYVFDTIDKKEIQFTFEDFACCENFIKWNHIIPYKEIPLTEEWLLDFGFINDDKLDLYYLKDVDFISLCQNTTKEYWCDFETYNGLKIEIKSVHQLQNLYFALTSQELKIKN